MSRDTEKISRGFAKAFEEAGDVSVDTDADSQQRSRRQRELDNWDIETGRRIAASEGIELDDARLRVVNSLRDYYLEHGLAENGRELGDMLDERFSAEGGRKYLRELFPEGPVAQGMKIAGLPVPRHTEDQGFGTAR
jgi:TusE/DsrC/DsvC family sulfur relay protein